MEDEMNPHKSLRKKNGRAHTHKKQNGSIVKTGQKQRERKRRS
jgi:hypothetical protein